MSEHDTTNAGKIAILESQIEELKRERGELVEMYKDLLGESMYLFNFYPNSFRYKDDPRNYFNDELVFLAKHGVTL